MKPVCSLREDPEKIQDLDLVERIIKTLDFLYASNGVEYTFAYIQSRMLGGSCFPVPNNYKPSDTSVVLGKYNKSYFEQRRNDLKRTA